jgi:hypothetical protein
MVEHGQLKGHRDLKVYQLAYTLAMKIFNASKSFPREEKYSLTKFADHQEASRQMSPKVFANANTQKCLSANLRTRTGKPPRLKSGWTLPTTVNICHPRVTSN